VSLRNQKSVILGKKLGQEETIRLLQLVLSLWNSYSTGPACDIARDLYDFVEEHTTCIPIRLEMESNRREGMTRKRSLKQMNDYLKLGIK
jgi:hypothetical protein